MKVNDDVNEVSKELDPGGVSSPGGGLGRVVRVEMRRHDDENNTARHTEAGISEDDAGPGLG